MDSADAGAPALAASLAAYWMVAAAAEEDSRLLKAIGPGMIRNFYFWFCKQ
jgi:hypothetical protein